MTMTNRYCWDRSLLAAAAERPEVDSGRSAAESGRRWATCRSAFDGVPDLEVDAARRTSPRRQRRRPRLRAGFVSRRWNCERPPLPPVRRSSAAGLILQATASSPGRRSAGPVSPTLAVNTQDRPATCNRSCSHVPLLQVIVIKRQFIRRINMARVTTRVSYNVRCSYSAKRLFSEVRKDVSWACFWKLIM